MCLHDLPDLGILAPSPDFGDIGILASLDLERDPRQVLLRPMLRVCLRMPSPLQQSRSLAVCEAMLPHCLPTLEPRRKYGYVYKEGERKTEGTIRLLRAQGPPGSEPNTHRNNSSPLPGGGVINRRSELPRVKFVRGAGVKIC